MSDEILQVNFRMPASLKTRLEEAAKVTGRSLTSEIVTRLEESLDEGARQRQGYIPGYDNGIRLELDESWFGQTGLSKEEFGKFVMSVLKKEIPHADDK